MKYLYKSLFANDIRAYLSLKEAMGYSQSSYNKFLHLFDTFCVENYPLETRLTKQIIDQWGCVRTGIEHENGLHRRMIALKGFAEYLQLIGKNPHTIQDGLIGKNKPFYPYIYSDLEIQSFFYTADTITNKTSCAITRELVLPVVFRILYCCGLRPQEVLKIQCDQIDLTTGTIFIQDSKAHKDRFVPMSEELTRLCSMYEKLVSRKIPARKYFFQHESGNAYSINWLQLQFKRCWKVAGITFPTNHHPRVYDWRHNFATRKIMDWLEAGKDINNLLPYLSAYLGHTELKNTLYYVHLMPERLILTGHMDWLCIPEVPDYED